MKVYKFIPYPSMVNGSALMPKSPQGLIGVTGGLQEDVKAFYAPESSCYKFGKTYICSKAVVERAPHFSCPVALFKRLPNACEFEVLQNPPLPVQLGGLTFMFFMEPTDIAVQCPNQDVTLVEAIVGRFNMSAFPGCEIRTSKWIFYADVPGDVTLQMETRQAPIIDLEPEDFQKENFTRPAVPNLDALTDLRTKVSVLLRERSEFDDGDVVAMSTSAGCLFFMLLILGYLCIRAMRVPQF